MNQQHRVYRHDFAHMTFPLFLAMLVVLLAGLGFFIYKDSWLFVFWVITCIACIGTIIRLFFLSTNRLTIDDTMIRHTFFQGKEEVPIGDVTAYSTEGKQLTLYNQAGEEVIRVFTTLLSEYTLTDIPSFQRLKKVYP